MPLLGCMSDQWSAWPKDWRKISTWPEVSSMGVHLGNGQPDTKANQMSSWPEVIPLLATRWLYWSVYLTKGQPETKADQMSSWTKVVPLLATKCLYWGVCLINGQPDSKIWEKIQLTWSLIYGGTSGQWSTWHKGWPNVKLTWSNTTLGY